MTQDVRNAPSEGSCDRLSPISEYDEVDTSSGSDCGDDNITRVALDTGSVSGSFKPRTESGRLKRSERSISDFWEKDSIFFFSFVTIRVEGQLFRVPRNTLENQSRYFRNLFSTRGAGDINEPIFLEGVERDAFRDLLCLLYPPPLSSSSTGLLLLARAVLLTREEWIKILDLSQKWGFTGIYTYAIERLEGLKLEEVQKLELALKYDIEHWHTEAYDALVKRQEPLSTEEGRRLGLDLTLRIANARERRLSSLIEVQPRQPNTSGSTMGDATDTFAPPFREYSHPGQQSISARELRAKKRATISITGDRREFWGPRDLMRNDDSDNINQGSSLTTCSGIEHRRLPNEVCPQTPRTLSPQLGSLEEPRAFSVPTLEHPVPHLEIKKKRHRLSAPVLAVQY